MRFELSPNKEYIEVKYQDRTLLFENAIKLKLSELQSRHQYDEVNAFLALMPEAKKKALFEMYIDVEELLRMPSDFQFMTLQLKSNICALYTLIRYDEIKAFLIKLALPIPPITKDVHDPNETNPDRTYITADYKELLILVFALRFMTPIWSRYLTKAKQVVSNKQKEYTAFALLGETWVYTSPAIDRLRRYIPLAMSGARANSSMGQMGISVSEIPELHLATVIVRRVSYGQLNYERDGRGVVASIWSFFHNLKQNGDAYGGGSIRDKKLPMDNSDSESKESTIDMYWSRVRRTIGEMSAVAVALADIHRCCKQVDPSIPDELIDRYCAMPIDYRSGGISEFHLVICQWVLCNVVPMDIVEDIHRGDLLNALIIARIALQHWGFYAVEGILSSDSYTPSMQDDDEYDDMQPAYSKLNQADTAMLVAEANITKPASKGAKQVNVAVGMIRYVVDLIEPQLWTVNFPEGSTLPTECTSFNYMVSPKGLPSELANLYMKVVSL